MACASQTRTTLLAAASLSVLTVKQHLFDIIRFAVLLFGRYIVHPFAGRGVVQFVAGFLLHIRV